MSSTPDEGGGIADSVKRLGATIIEIMHTRLELAGLEFEDQVRVVLSAIITFIALSVFVVLALMAFTWLVIEAVSPAYRLGALAAVVVIYLLLAVLTWARLRHILSMRPRFLAVTLNELEKDKSGILRAANYVGETAGRSKP